MEKQTYPYYMVQGYRCDTYREAYQLAKVVAERTGRPVSIDEKLDAMTPIYSVGIV